VSAQHKEIAILNIEQALNWIVEREQIRARREAGLPPPWTDDLIFQQYSFCNVEHENDRVTKYIATEWRDPHADDPQLWFAMTVARLINWPDTLAELGYPVPWNPGRFASVIAGRMARKETAFGPGYVISNGGSSQAKASYLASKVLEPMWRVRGWYMTPDPGKSLMAYCDKLRQFEGIGSFIAGQIIADLKYVPALRSSPDWMSFVVPGPGSRRGLNRILGRPVDNGWASDAAWREAFRRFEAAIRPELERIGLGHLHAQDLQNVLCETDKYLRAVTGEGKPKRRYPGGKNSGRSTTKGVLMRDQAISTEIAGHITNIGEQA
jgi:hypothetical protein